MSNQRNPNLQSKLLHILPFVFAFDFRGDEGGSIVQYVMAALALILTVYLLAKVKFRVPGYFSGYLVFGIVALVVGFSSAIIFNAPFSQVIRVALPFVLFVLSSWIGSHIASDFDNLRRFLGAAICAGVINSVFRYYWGLNYNDLGFGEIRYQILTPIMPFLVSYCIVGVLYTKRLPVLPMLLSLWIVVLSLLSVTRSLILTACFGVACSLLYLMRVGIWNVNHASYAKWRLPSFVAFCIMCVAGGGVTVVMRPDVFADWNQRLFESRSTVDDMDITYITRVAEARGIWEGGVSGPVSFLLGRGFGNFYSWSSEYAEHMKRLSENLARNMDQYWSGTHSVFTHGFLFGGVVGLIWVIYIYALPLARGYFAAAALRFTLDSELVRVYFIFNISIFLFISQSITSNPLGGERISAQFLGLCCGIVLTMANGLKYSFSRIGFKHEAPA